MPELIRGGCLCNRDSWDAIRDVDIRCKGLSPEREREARLGQHGCDSFSHGPVSSLCNPILLWTIAHSVLPHNPCLCGETKDSRRHILPSLVISQRLDLRTMMVLSVRLERFESLEGV